MEELQFREILLYLMTLVAFVETFAMFLNYKILQVIAEILERQQDVN